jgi:NADPH-dependent 2,4-dienoyl-CoA reductase/sulfur reductase-like enzyme/predicted acylesterase/phospholipase RssA
MQHADFVLLGGGLASATAAETLREQGERGSILIISREPLPPYNRPPLSKRYLLGEITAESLQVLDAERYRELGIELRLETLATLVDTKSRVVVADRGDDIQYRKLLIATGGRPNNLAVPGCDLDGIFCLRTIADADVLKAAAAQAKRAVVVGGSFLGMEVAATLSELGLAVTIVDQEQRLFARLDAPDVSTFLSDLYRRRNIDTRLSQVVVSFEGESRVRKVVTSRGAPIDCDLVVLGAGITPSIGFLHGSGIALGDGILVNQQLQSSDPDIYAAGDVASVYDPAIGRHHRVEHWDSAIKQARVAARNMLGQRRIHNELSYFFFDVFDLSFEVLQPSVDASEKIVRGNLANRSYALFYLKDDIPRGLISIGRPPQETRATEALIRYRVNLRADKAKLGDPGFQLSSIPNQTVLVLQGGGAMGAFECGVSRALEERGIIPDVVAGVSIGAFNGAIIAANPGCATAALESFWDQLTVRTEEFGDGQFDDAIASWQMITFGSPNFFRPRWSQPVWSPEQLPYRWTSLYDTSPMKALLEQYVDFSKLKNGPIRLLVSAVNVETAELEVFDSYCDDLTAEHILASGSLPPSFPWTTINGRHYWDGGIISNSPLEFITERCGSAGKLVYVVDLYSTARPLPKNLMEVSARRDEIVYSERIKRDTSARDIARDYGRLVEDLLQELDPARAEIMRQRPRFIELMGESAPLTVVRIVREPEEDETLGRDFDFSRRAVLRNLEHGYAAALKLIDAHT